MRQAKEESDKALLGTDPSSQSGDRDPSEMTPSLAPQRPQQGTAGTTVGLGGAEESSGTWGWVAGAPKELWPAPGNRVGGREGMKLEEKGQKPCKDTQAARFPAHWGCW